jgi:hypothetical protein
MSESESSIWNFCKLPRELDEATKHEGGSGVKILTQLFLTYFLFCKAMSRDWVTVFSLTVYYTKVLAVDTNVANLMITAATSPFGIKTLWGAMSDALPCLGYNKRFYILWGVGVSICCMVGLYVLVDEGVHSEDNPAPSSLVFIATALFFGFEYGGATCDSLTQARYTELMKMMGKPTIVAFVWFLMNSCTLFSSWGNLWITEGSYKILFVPAILAALPMLVPASLNWLAEPPADHFCKPDIAKVAKHKGCFALSMVMAVGALAGTLLIMLQAYDFLMPFYMGMGCVFIVMSRFTLPKTIWGPAVYMFLCSALRLFFSATLQGWYTYRNEAGLPTETQNPCEGSTDPSCTSWCIRDGPGFSTSFYQLWGNFIGAIAAVFAVMIFDNVIVNWNVRPAFWVTTMFQMGSTMLEVSILERWNHIPFGTTPGVDQNVDQWFFLFGPLCIEKIVEMLDFMPCNVLIGNLCPKNMEATIFAVLAGSQNFGSNIARVMGSVAVQELGVNFPANSNACVNERVGWFFNLKGLTVARVAGGIILPAITVPLTFLMLPDKPLAEKYDDDDDGAVELREMNEDGPTFPPNKQGTVQDLVRTGTSMSALAMLSIASGGKVVSGVREHVL